MAEETEGGLSQEEQESRRLAATWLKRCEKAYSDEKEWRQKTKQVIDRYTDERSHADENASQFNIFFANVETLRPAVYANPPVPEARRRYLDKDPNARRAATILKRSLQYSVDNGGLDETLQRDVDDLLMGGRGQMWVRYRPFFQKTIRKSDEQPPEQPPDKDSDEEQVVDEELVFEEIDYDYVPWGHFIFDRPTTWKRCRWVARIHSLFRSEVVAQFGADVASKVQYSARDEATVDEVSNNGEAYDQVAVFYEVWNKTSREVYVVSRGYPDGLIRREKDPLLLDNFFPCPEPLMGIHSSKHWIPRPEFVLYQDLANELDDVTMRLKVLTTALQRRGVYDSSIEGLESLTKIGDNQFVGIPNFRDLFEKGGLDAVFDEQDLTGLIVVIKELSVRQEQLKQLIYEVTGIADIIRGATDPNETLGAQRLKSQYGSLRIRRRQKAVAMFAVGGLRIAGEIIAERFAPQTLQLMASIEIVEDPKNVVLDHQMTQQQFDIAIQLLRQEKVRGFKIAIETDSTIEVQDNEEKEGRVELLTAIGQFMGGALPLVQAGVITGPIAMELITFAMRGFKLGSRLEDMMDLVLAQMQGEEGEQGSQQAELQAQVQQLTMQLQEVQQQAQAIQQENEQLKADRSLEEAKVTSEIQRKNAETQSDMAIEKMMAEFKIQLAAREAAFDERLKAAEQRSKSAIRMAQAKSKERATNE